MEDQSIFRRFNPPHFVLKKGIHGMGVFTTIDIKKGDILFQLTGEILDHPTRTSVEIGKDKHIEDEIGGHINHSCEPNTRVAKKIQSFVSLRNIRQGEEITFDYNENETELAVPFVCECCGKKVLGRTSRNKNTVKDLR